jgi:hypothetical protein
VARRLSLSVETADVPGYWYGALPVAYPVLSVVTAVGERVPTCRRAAERALNRLRDREPCGPRNGSRVV